MAKQFVTLSKAGRTEKGQMFNLRVNGAHSGELVASHNKKTKAVFVHSVYVAGGANTIGYSGARNIARALKKQYKTVSGFEGVRVTGIRNRLSPGDFHGRGAKTKWNGQDSMHLGQGGRPGGHAGYGK